MKCNADSLRTGAVFLDFHTVSFGLDAFARLWDHGTMRASGAACVIEHVATDFAQPSKSVVCPQTLFPAQGVFAGQRPILMNRNISVDWSLR